jgi:DNA-binding SARP family transcriptional activator
LTSETPDETIPGSGQAHAEVHRDMAEVELGNGLVDCLPDGVMVVDSAGRTLVANRAIYALGIRADTHGETCCELFGCRQPGSTLEDVCLTEECLVHTSLPEIRLELPPGRPSHAVWIHAGMLAGTTPRVLFRLRVSEAHSAGEGSAGLEPAIGPRLGILTLGRTKLDTPTGTVIGGWLDQRSGQLLKYLVCERHRVVQVDEIAEALWAGADERGPSIVRHHIHGLRNALEPWRRKRSPSSFVVHIPPSGYALDRNLVRVDADVFEQLVSDGLAAEGNDADDAIELLERALTWYRGEFLAELPYVVWTLAERERLRDLALNGLRALGRLLEERGDVDRATGYLDQAAKMQPFDTDLERELMSLAVRSGRRSVALRRYAALRVRMLRQFGEEPDFDLGDLIRARGRHPSPHDG